MNSLDIENPDALRKYLVGQQLARAGDALAIAVLPGGVSSRTVLVEQPDGRGLVFKQALPKLRVAADWFSDPVRVHREAMAIRCLETLAPAGTVPRFVFEDHENHVVGMEAVPRPHENWKSMLLAGRLDTDHVKQFARWLGTVHRGSWLEREPVAAAFDDRSFFESLRIEPYWQYTAGRVPETAAFLEQLIASCRGRRLALVHGDFSPKNVLVRDGRLVLLDFEVIHWGDPAFDLGFGLTHLLSKAHHVRDRRAAFAEAAGTFMAEYLKTLGDVPWANDVEVHAVRHALGCMLARAAGRSPLEYLGAEARARQVRIVNAIMAHPPATVDELAREWVKRLEAE